jgi:hypothetical protein
MAVLAAWLGASPPAVAVKLRPAAQALLERIDESESNDPQLRQRSQHRWAALAWHDGLLGFAQRDRSAIERARRDARRSGWYQANLVERSLAAFHRALSGERKPAGRELAALEEYCIEHQDCNSYTPHIAVQRLAAAEWLAEHGELEQAARLLSWQDVFWRGWGIVHRDALDGPTYLARARIEEARDNSELAAEYYRQFLRRYDRAMPSMSHLIEEARVALVRLSRESTPAGQ